MNKQRGWTVVELLVSIVVVGGVIGWIGNIVKLAHTCCVIDGMMVLRIIGIFVPPLGAVMGYF